MSKVMAITNQKGGVGKTTTAINLAASLAQQQQRVLLLDLDPQGNTTMGSGVDKYTLSRSMRDVLMQQCTMPEALVVTSFGYDLLPANADLTEAEVTLLGQPERERILATALAPLRAAYDFILIDCPPALNTLTLNALVATDSVLIPMQCEYFALEGLAALLDTIAQVKRVANRQIMLEGVLRTMYDGRSRLCAEVSQQLLAHFAEKVYRTVIPRNVRLAESPSHGMPVLHYDKASTGAAGYRVLASEILSQQMESVS